MFLYSVNMASCSKLTLCSSLISFCLVLWLNAYFDGKTSLSVTLVSVCYDMTNLFPLPFTFRHIPWLDVDFFSFIPSLLFRHTGYIFICLLLNYQMWLISNTFNYRASCTKTSVDWITEVMSQAAKEVTAEWNLTAFILTRMTLHTCIISMTL